MLEQILAKIASGKASAMVEESQALPGREEKMRLPERHFVSGHPMSPPYPEGMEVALFAMGCFWGAERLFWQTGGVYLTAVGYAGGFTPNPTYDEVCTGMTGHAEAVLVVYDPKLVAYEDLLRKFWESHDPTQGMRQGNDHGTQYRSAIGVYTEHQKTASRTSLESYQRRLTQNGFPPVTTGILESPTFYYAESYHQQYLAKNPDGYCGLRGTGVSCSA